MHLAYGTNIWAKRSKISFIYSRKGKINPTRVRAGLLQGPFVGSHLLQESQAIDSSQRKEPRAATLHQESRKSQRKFLLPHFSLPSLHLLFPHVEKNTPNAASVCFVSSFGTWDNIPFIAVNPS